MDAEAVALGRNVSARAEASTSSAASIAIVVASLMLLSGCNTKKGDEATTSTPPPAPATVTPRATVPSRKRPTSTLSNRRQLPGDLLLLRHKEDPDYKVRWTKYPTAPRCTRRRTRRSKRELRRAVLRHRRRPARRTALLTVLPLAAPLLLSSVRRSLHLQHGLRRSRTTGDGGGKYLSRARTGRVRSPRASTRSSGPTPILRSFCIAPSCSDPRISTRSRRFGRLPGRTSVGVPRPTTACACPADRLRPPLTAISRRPRRSSSRYSISPCGSRRGTVRGGVARPFGHHRDRPDQGFDADKLTPAMRSAIEGGWTTPGLNGHPQEGQDRYRRSRLGPIFVRQRISRQLPVPDRRVPCSASTATPPASAVSGSSTDSTGAPLTGTNNYTSARQGSAPPVNASSSLTMYKLPQSLLVETR